MDQHITNTAVADTGGSLLHGKSGQVVGRLLRSTGSDTSADVTPPADLTAVLRYRNEQPTSGRKPAIGEPVDVPMTRHECRQLQPETFAPFRVTPMYQGKVAKQGLVFWETTRRMVWAESRLETFAVLELDREPGIVDVGSQPFQIVFHTGTTVDPVAPRRHVPDFFARHADGTGEVIDVKPRDLVDDKARAQFEWTAFVCAQAGWGYRVMHNPSRRRMLNTMWLAGFRRQPVFTDVVAPVAFDMVADQPVPWTVLIGSLSKHLLLPTPFVIPAVGHLVWRHDLRLDLDAPLTGDSLVSAGGGWTR